MTNEEIVEKLKQTDLTKYQNLSDLFDMARNMEDYDNRLMTGDPTVICFGNTPRRSITRLIDKSRGCPNLNVIYGFILPPPPPLMKLTSFV